MASLSIYFQNVRGLRTKTHSCLNNILSNNYDIIVMVETWLCEGIFDRELCDNRYDVFRLDRDLVATGKTTGGGIMICVRRELHALLHTNLTQFAPTEILCIRISCSVLSTEVDLDLIVTYLRGDYSCQPGDLIAFLSLIKYMFGNHTDKFNNYIVMGDFNLPFIQWKDGLPLFINKNESSLARELASEIIDLLTFNGFTQYNEYKNISSGSILDLVFSNFPLQLSTCNYPISKVDSFHPPLCIDASDLVTLPLRNVNNIKRLFRKGDYTKINEHLSKINWEQELSHRSTNNSVDLLYETIYQCFNLYIPKVTINNNNKTYPTWYSKLLINLIIKKGKIHKKWKRYKNQNDYYEFSELRSRCHKLHAACYSKYLYNVQQSIKVNVKNFWSFVKSRRGGSNYPNIFTLFDQSLINGPDIVQGFNDFFYNMFSSPAASYPLLNLAEPQSASVSNMHTVHISKRDILTLLKNLDPNKGPGNDDVPPLFIVRCAEALSHPLHLIFNKSINEGDFPDAWKIARIVPVHKKGSKKKIENYRPISILNVFGKVFEKAVYDSIYSLIANSVPLEQHGFLKRRSTTTNLTLFTKYVLAEVEKGHQVDVIYTDFEKAFDRVDHVILLAKLSKLGIHGDLLRWIKSYLTNRSQVVVLGGHKSNYCNVPSGVPQGSHLGPLFYNAYLYDIYKFIHNSKFLLYADDTKIFLNIKDQIDCHLLQQDLDRLASYYRINRISINVAKCQILSLTKKKHPYLYNYSINGVSLDRVHVVRDLGLQVDAGITFQHHIDSIVNKASKALGFVMRICSPFRNAACIKNIYFAYVRSNLEYCSTVWMPYYKIHICRIEKLQKRFIGYLNYRSSTKPLPSYAENCKQHNLMTLEQRRTLLDMMLLFDILNSQLDSSELIEAIRFNVPRRRTRHTPLLNTPSHTTKYGRNETITRISHTYNNFFSVVDPFSCTNKNIFRKKITQILTE